MKTNPRYLQKQAEKDLQKKMVFIGGPRQVGKTTLAWSILGETRKGYLNWDVTKHREQILRGELPLVKLWAFDEIHKYRSWRNFLKGIYDLHRGKRRILVTGSARLDLYRRGGDSLQGRYHYLRLHPLSCAELGIKKKGEFQTLLRLGGFPEPFWGQSELESKRWSQEYRTRLIQENLVPLEQVQDLGNLEMMMLRLPELVGSPLSINALREDLQVSHKTVSKWLMIMERLYSIFRIPPFGAPRIRAVKKEQKHYHVDWTLVTDPSFRFENLTASHLLKWVHFQQDTTGSDLDLRYFRDIDGREVDFILVENKKPVMAIECKLSDAEVSKGLRYFKSKFPDCESWQISALGNKDYITQENIRVGPAYRLLQNLI